MGRSIKARLTLKAIDAAAPDPAGDVLIWDTAVPGFGLRIKPSDTRSFVLTYRNRHGRSRWYTIARLGVMTPDEARVEARRLLAEVARGNDPAEQRAGDRSAITVQQLCEEYLDRSEKGLLLTRRGKPKKALTLYTDRGRIKRHVIPLLGHLPVKDLSSADVRRFARDVAAGKTAADEKTGKHGRAIVKGGPGASARTLGLLGAVLQYAADEGVISINPVRGVVRQRDNRREVVLSRDQYRELGARLEAAEDRAENEAALDAIRLIALTGARRSEALRLKWSEVDLAGRCLRLEDTKTGASLRPLGAPAVALLKARQERARGAHVFPGRSPQSALVGLPRAWERTFKGSTFADLSPHSLRHAFAATCDELGLSLPTIAALLGHTTRVGGVTGGYIRKADPALLAAADRVSTWIDNAMRGKTATVSAIGATSKR